MMMQTLPKFSVIPDLNYIGLFLTFRCNLACAYCINMPELYGDRSKVFPSGRFELSPEEWARALERFPEQEDLPITLQGGEPGVYWGGKGVAEIVNACERKFDLLTNLVSSPLQFLGGLAQPQRLRRRSPYPSIRVSYHPEQMERVWKGHGIDKLVEHCLSLEDVGFSVGPEKADSDVGIYMVDHPENNATQKVLAAVAGKVPFETKEFLGEFQGDLYGTYRYPWSTNLLSSKTWHAPLSCECKTSEVLIDPLGFVWGCHYYLYQNWAEGVVPHMYSTLMGKEYRYTEFPEVWSSPRPPVGHILDPEFCLADVFQYRDCQWYGNCIGCDTKVKNNRFQSLDDMGKAHTSVAIRNLCFPEQLMEKLENASAYVEAGIICENGG